MDLTKRRMPVTFSLPQSLLIRLDTVSEDLKVLSVEVGG